jgi:hypothetical protein
LSTSNALPVEVLSVPVALDLEPPNRVPPSREKSTTREPKQTERRSPLQSGRRDFRPKPTARKPDFCRASSTQNVMARKRKQRRPRGSQKAIKESSMPNLVIMAARKTTSQQSLHEMSEWTSMSDLEHLKLRSNIERASSARDVTATTRNQKSRRSQVIKNELASERTLLGATSRQSSEVQSVDDAQMLPIQGLHENPALNGQTVTIAKFLEDEYRNRVKSGSVEVTDATSMEAVSSPLVHKWKVVPTSAHATRHPVMPEKASSQHFVVQSRKSDPLSGNGTSTPSGSVSSKGKRPAYQTSKSESFLGVMC